MTEVSRAAQGIEVLQREIEGFQAELEAIQDPHAFSDPEAKKDVLSGVMKACVELRSRHSDNLNALVTKLNAKAQRPPAERLINAATCEKIFGIKRDFDRNMEALGNLEEKIKQEIILCEAHQAAQALEQKHCEIRMAFIDTEIPERVKIVNEESAARETMFQQHKTERTKKKKSLARRNKKQKQAADQENESVKAQRFSEWAMLFSVLSVDEQDDREELMIEQVEDFRALSDIFATEWEKMAEDENQADNRTSAKIGAASSTAVVGGEQQRGHGAGNFHCRAELLNDVLFMFEEKVDWAVEEMSGQQIHIVPLQCGPSFPPGKFSRTGTDDTSSNNNNKTPTKSKETMKTTPAAAARSNTRDVISSRVTLWAPTLSLIAPGDEDPVPQCVPSDEEDDAEKNEESGTMCTGNRRSAAPPPITSSATAIHNEGESNTTPTADDDDDDGEGFPRVKGLNKKWEVGQALVIDLDRFWSTKPRIAVLLAHGGYFGGTVYDIIERKHIAHKTFARYVTRKGQGGRQSAHQGRTDTAGSQIRQQQETKWKAEVIQTMQQWKSEGLFDDRCVAIFYHAPGPLNVRMLLQESGISESYAEKLVKVPFTTGRPNFTEAQWVTDQLLSVTYRRVSLPSVMRH